MQMVGPFRLTGLVGTCDVGEVWSAVDSADQPVTVAVLTGAAAQDQPWRDAFAATAYTLSGAGDDGLPILDADYTAPEPWVACADEPGPGAAQIFMALGMQPTPATRPTEAQSTQPSTPAQTSTAAQAQPATDAAPPAETAPAAQAATPAPAANPVASASTSVADPALAAAAARAVSAPPGDQPNLDQPTLSQPALGQQGMAQPTSLELARQDAMWLHTQQPVSGVPLAPYTVDVPAAAPSWRRTAVWVAVVAVVALALGVAGGALGSSLANKDDKPAAGASPTENLDLGLPSASPTQPGVEPPRQGGWPDDWPESGPDDDTKNMSGLSGLGFSFKAPEGWDCVQKARGSGYVHYTCGRLPEIGGDLIVRHCPAACNDDRRIEMRSAEEAWGVRWTKSGAFVAWGDTKQVNGEARYGLAYVGYWRSERDDRVDRQLVFRMTSPLDQADQLRKVVNSIRDATFTS